MAESLFSDLARKGFFVVGHVGNIPYTKQSATARMTTSGCFLEGKGGGLFSHTYLTLHAFRHICKKVFGAAHLTTSVLQDASGKPMRISGSQMVGQKPEITQSTDSKELAVRSLEYWRRAAGRGGNTITGIVGVPPIVRRWNCL